MNEKTAVMVSLSVVNDVGPLYLSTTHKPRTKVIIIFGGVCAPASWIPSEQPLFSPPSPQKFASISQISFQKIAARKGAELENRSQKSNGKRYSCDAHVLHFPF